MRDFAYVHPETLEEASEILGRRRAASSRQRPAAAFAGGTDLLGLMKDGVLEPGTLVDLKRLPGLRAIDHTPGEGLTIGALVTIAELAASPVVASSCRALAEAAAQVASPQLRNVGTLGGNLCQRPRCWYFRGDFNCLKKNGPRCFAFDGQNRYHCIVGGGPCYIVHPSDTAVALLAAGAEAGIYRGGEIRRVPLEEFFVLPSQNLARENILEPGDILAHVHVPEHPEGGQSGYLKFKERAVWDFAVVSVAAVVRKQGAAIGWARVAFGGVAPIPWRDAELDRRLAGRGTDQASLDAVAEAVLDAAAPLAENGFKLNVARALLKQILSRL